MEGGEFHECVCMEGESFKSFKGLQTEGEDHYTGRGSWILTLWDGCWKRGEEQGRVGNVSQCNIRRRSGSGLMMCLWAGVVLNI